jgi:hypothetical protein
MITVILDVRLPDDSMADFVLAWKTGKTQKSAWAYCFSIRSSESRIPVEGGITWQPACSGISGEPRNGFHGYSPETRPDQKGPKGDGFIINEKSLK